MQGDRVPDQTGRRLVDPIGPQEVAGRVRTVNLEPMVPASVVRGEPEVVKRSRRRATRGQPAALAGGPGAHTENEDPERVGEQQGRAVLLESIGRLTGELTVGDWNPRDDLRHEHGTPLFFARPLAPGLRFRVSSGAASEGCRSTTSCSTSGPCFTTSGSPRTTEPRSRGFEVDSANAARDFLRANGVDEAAAGLVWDAIALHTTPEIPWRRDRRSRWSPAASTTSLGRELGRNLRRKNRAGVLAAYPRVDFEEGIVSVRDGFGLRARRRHSGP